MTESAVSCGSLIKWALSDRVLMAHHERGILEIELIADEILRVRFNPQGIFTPRRSWDVVKEEGLQPSAPLQCREVPEKLIVQAPSCEIEIHRGTGQLRFRHISGHSFAEDLSGPYWRTVSLEETQIVARAGDRLPAGKAQMGIAVEKGMAANEGYYGFGQRTGKLNRRYRRLTNWNVDLAGASHSRGDDNLYQACPFFLAARPGFAWGLFLHSTWYNQFDVGASQEDRLRIFTLGGELDYYLLTGPTPAAVVEQLTRLTGRPLLPPLWALGFHQSRWSYSNDQEVEGIAQDFRARNIPLDVVHLDIDYMEGFRVFTWDTERFADPQETINRLHAQGIRVVAILDPGVKGELQKGYGVADEGVAKEVFITNPDGSLFRGYCWPGEALFPDFSRSLVREWWGEQQRVLLEAGVDGLWNDMNEPSIFDRPFGEPNLQQQPMPLAAPQGEAGERTCHAEVHNLYGALMAQASYEGLRRLRPHKRPWVLTRSAFLGTQRYAVSWMGDNSSWWEHLELSLPQLASMGLCGMPHVGVDIGGFYENAHSELYARWMELGTFYPFMRCHTALGTRLQEPWCFGPEVEALSRRAILLRYRLLPYFYTLAHLAHRTGAPLVRPLLYQFPEQPELYPVEDQWMVGPHLMVAPIYQPGARQRLVHLPQGLWYDFWTGEPLSGGKPRVWEAPLGKPGVFVPAGALLTLGNPRQSTNEPLAELTLAVYPGVSGHWTLIEDDGDSNDYQQGGIAETRFALESDGAAVIVHVDRRQGPYQPSPRMFTLKVYLPQPPKQVLFDDLVINDGQWESTSQALLFSYTDDGQAHRLVISHLS
ncbi:Alpha-glucosidase [Nitrosococcus halophilus Nc 4]|uniref:Alpha-glucosidase n=1 Tax=Nitrosococcus halophilus (strain Nc4) TaxID=472759 RepID=D5C502_NITHN|nr:glycoside hydrolase family 31 protein [Nitrosococcus halophilus]ADE15225.1 Alpha-glucosidase [Nitrosococcus halophilus Nc 4]